LHWLAERKVWLLNLSALCFGIDLVFGYLLVDALQLLAVLLSTGILLQCGITLVSTVKTILKSMYLHLLLNPGKVSHNAAMVAGRKPAVLRPDQFELLTAKGRPCCCINYAKPMVAWQLLEQQLQDCSDL